MSKLQRTHTVEHGARDCVGAHGQLARGEYVRRSLLKQAVNGAKQMDERPPSDHKPKPSPGPMQP